MSTTTYIYAGIHSVKTDMKAQTLTVDGTIEPDNLLSYLRRKVHKLAEIISSKITSKPEKKEEKKEKGEGKPTEDKATESTKIIEVKEEMKVVEVRQEGNAPYFIHYVYAPQTFSDENPNACSVM